MENDEETVKELVREINRGFVEGNLDLITANSVGSYFMWARNHSAEPTNWTAELFDADLSGLQAGWEETCSLGNQNELEFLNVHSKNGLALVTTRETGANKFYSWQNRVTTYMAGRLDSGWKLLGVVIEEKDE